MAIIRGAQNHRVLTRFKEFWDNYCCREILSLKKYCNIKKVVLYQTKFYYSANISSSIVNAWININL